MATQASDSIRQKSRTSSADDLAVVVQRAQSFTNASGAAIAISEGNSDEIVCRARSGSSAPDVGAALRVEGSFTGICIQTGRELRCDDAETDTRMDTAAIRALGIRSMVVTPIRDDGKVVGVLAVFAPTPHAFTITHVAVLKTMADQISVLLQKERRTKDEPHQIEAPALAPAPVAVAKPPVAAVPLPPPVVIKPASAPPVATGVASAPARSSSSSAPKIDPRPVALAAEIAPPVPFPKKEEKREYRPEPSSTARTSFGTLDAVAGEPEKSSANKFILMGVLAAAVLVAGLAWFFLRTHKSSSTAATQTVQPTQNAAPATPGAAAGPSNPVVTPSVPVPAAPVSSAAVTNPKPEVSEKPAARKSDSKKEPQDKEPAPATVALSSAPSRITKTTPTDQSPDVSPTLAVGGGSSSGLASLARPVNTAAPSMVAQSDLVNAKAIRAVPAMYPQLAKARRISGTAVVKVTVGKDGKVSNPRFISGPMIFRDAAFDAVKQWLFKPAELNGQVIEQETEIRLKFNP